MPKRVLILEDHEGLLRLYSKLLNKAGYVVIEANSIAQAEAFLNQQLIDVFICDLHLDNESGATLLERRISALQEQGTHVVVVSAESHYRDYVQQLGADFFLTKPVSMEELLTLINRLTMFPSPGLVA